MTAETRCPSCGRSVSPEFRYCPYCQNGLGAGASDVPLVTPAPAQRQGRRDLLAIGLGLVALGGFGLVGAILSVAGAHRGPHQPVSFVFGALLLVLAGFVTAGAARGGWLGAGSGLAKGCLSIAALVGIGALLMLAMIGYAFLSCISDLNKLGH
jgi:hypothetical protein